MNVPGACPVRTLTPPSRQAARLFLAKPPSPDCAVSFPPMQPPSEYKAKLLPETANRVEMYVTHRKQRIAYLSTRDTSRRAPHPISGGFFNGLA